MNQDPVQQLIDAGAIPSTPFASNSRYHGVPIALHADTPYVLRRFIPQRRDIQTVAEYVVRALERPDSLAAQLLGDPELYWLIADANVVTDPFELTRQPGERIAIPQPLAV
jgi:hypothetical protein